VHESAAGSMAVQLAAWQYSWQHKMKRCGLGRWGSVVRVLAAKVRGA